MRVAPEAVPADRKPGAGIDRTVIRQLLAMTPAERILLLIEEVRNLEAFDRAMKR